MFAQLVKKRKKIRSLILSLRAFKLYKLRFVSGERNKAEAVWIGFDVIDVVHQMLRKISKRLRRKLTMLINSSAI
jgi:hypothetical protein